jgi:hypothetical protein
MLTPFAQKFLSKALFLFWLAVMSPPLLLLGWLRQSYPDLRTELSGLGILLVLVWLFGSYWLSATTAHHMFNENRMFLTAVKHTFYDLKFRLAFLPLVGGWFMADEDKTKHDDIDA